MKNQALIYFFITVLFVVSITAQSFAQTVESSLPIGVEKVTSVEGVTEYRLPNGLRVLLYPDQSKPVIIVNMVYLVGSRQENYGETGMAHLLEHMLFKGSPKHLNIPAEFKERGALSNGSTTVDRTNYYEQFNATDENLEWALDLESDRMVNSFVAKKDLDSEMTVVRNEMERNENSAGSILNQRVKAAAFDWHNYGKTTIGARSDVENVPIERLQAYYKTYYQPDNAVLLIGGKFDAAKTLALVSKYFSPIPKPTRQLPKIYTVDPAQDGERTVTVRRTGDSQIVSAGYHIPSGLHPDMPALSVLGQMLSSSPSGPLYKALVETKKANSASGRPAFEKDSSLFYFSSSLGKTQSIDDVRQTLLETVENYGKQPLSADEFQRAKEFLIKSVENQTNDVVMFMGAVLTGYVAAGDWRSYYLFRDRLKEVKLEDVQRVANKYLIQSNRTVGMFIPTENPTRAQIEQVSDNQIAEMFKDFKGGKAVASGEAFDPTPANIEARVKRLKTPSGMEIVLLTKQNRGDKVNAIISLFLGNEKDLVNRRIAGMVAAGMLQRGSLKYDRQQIQDEFNKLKTRFGIGGDASRSGANLDTTRDNLIPSLKLTAEILRNPAFDPKEFEEVRQSYIAGFERQLSDPQRLAENVLMKNISSYPKGDFREFLSPAEIVAQLKTLTLDDVKKFYQDFYGASNAKIAIVGDFDDKAVVPAIEEAFGNWKSKTSFAPISEVYYDAPAINKTIETPDKANAYFTASMNLKISDTDPDYPALFIGNSIFGGGSLNSRLGIRIRQKEGLSYGVSSRIMVDEISPAANFRATAIAAPENIAKLEGFFNEELARLLKDGITEEELANAKTGFLQQRQIGRSQDNAVANKLRDYLLMNRTFSWDADFEKKISELTVAQVNAALRKYLNPAKMSIVKAGDFAKVAQK